MNLWKKEIRQKFIDDESIGSSDNNDCVIAKMRGVNRESCDGVSCKGCFIESIDWLTQESESEELPTLDCSNCEGCGKNAEPQQSKARFIKDTDGIMHQIKVEDIDEIKKGHWNNRISDDVTLIKLKNDKNILVFKPINEVIQQLGIEVV